MTFGVFQVIGMRVPVGCWHLAATFAVVGNLNYCVVAAVLQRLDQPIKSVFSGDNSTVMNCVLAESTTGVPS